MAIIVKFSSGEERQYDAEEASPQDHGRLFVLYKRKEGKWESTDTFPAEQVILARLPDGQVLLGRGRVEPGPLEKVIGQGLSKG